MSPDPVSDGTGAPSLKPFPATHEEATRTLVWTGRPHGHDVRIQPRHAVEIRTGIGP